MRKIIRIITKTIIFLFLLCFITYFSIDFTYSIMGFNHHVNYSSLRSAEDYGITSKEIDVMTSDKLKIKGYEVKVDNSKGVVIILSGIQYPSVTHFYGQSKMLADNGWSSILVDNRGHGKSDGDKITFATQDVRDVAAIVNYAEKEYKGLPIVVMGVSMGGATAINSAANIDNIDGLISMSAYSSWPDVAIETIAKNNISKTILQILKPAIWFHGYIKYGPDFKNNIPEQSMKKLGDKPALFIHSEEDTEVLIENLDRLLKNYDGDGEVWRRPGYEHFIVKDNQIEYPYSDEEYVEKILKFLKENFQ